MTQTADVLVVGLGAHGAAAFHELAHRGRSVIGIEQAARGEMIGSSGGITRIIRLAYFEHPDYVPLAIRAWNRWRALEAETGLTLLHQTGGIYIGSPGTSVFDGAVASATTHGLPHEVLRADEIRRRFPPLAVSDELAGLYEDQAGVLFSERIIEAEIATGIAHGGDARFGERVTSWQAHADGVDVETTAGRYAVGKLILAPGAWLSSLMPPTRLGVELRVERVPLLWLEPPDPTPFDPERFPVYILETEEDGSFYGFPYYPDQGLKVARHHSGDFTTADALDRRLHATDEERVRAFVRTRLPLGDGPLRSSAVCMYTNTPDEHFLIDVVPGEEDVIVASACSGHGFKFSSFVGELLADLAEEKTRPPESAFLAFDRFRDSAIA